MERRQRLLDWFTLAIAVDVALSQFLAVPHDLDLVEHSRPLVYWYGFPFVWMAGPEPGELFSMPIRNWSIPGLLIDITCIVAVPLAVRYSISWWTQANAMPLRFHLGRMFGGICSYCMMCAAWLNPQWCFFCHTWTCKLVVNRGLLSSAIYLPLIVPAILFSAIALEVVVEFSFTEAKKSLRRNRESSVSADVARPQGVQTSAN